MAKYYGTALPSMGEQSREQVNTGEDGSWELWGGCGNLAPQFHLEKTWEACLPRQIKTFLNLQKLFPVTLDLKLLFPTMWMAAGGWEL